MFVDLVVPSHSRAPDIVSRSSSPTSPPSFFEEALCSRSDARGRRVQWSCFSMTSFRSTARSRSIELSRCRPDFKAVDRVDSELTPKDDTSRSRAPPLHFGHSGAALETTSASN